MKRLLALALLLAVALFFLRTPGAARFPAHPDPAADYGEALRRVAAAEARDGPEISPECRTRLMTHGARTARAVVLLHGLTNCPEQFRALGERLYERGANVYIPRLPEHGLADRMTPVHARLDARGAAPGHGRGGGRRPRPGRQRRRRRALHRRDDGGLGGAGARRRGPRRGHRPPAGTGPGARAAHDAGDEPDAGAAEPVHLVGRQGEDRPAGAEARLPALLDPLGGADAAARRRGRGRRPARPARGGLDRRGHGGQRRRGGQRRGGPAGAPLAGPRRGGHGPSSSPRGWG